MRHRRLRRKLGIKSPHRRALLRNLAQALVRHKRIRTTHARAKEASAFIEKLITLAKRGGDLHTRRLLIARLGCDDSARTLHLDIAPKFKTRNGGYTRVLRLVPRPGDQSEMAILEFTELFEAPAKTKKEKKEKHEEKTPSKAPAAKETVKEKPKKSASEPKVKAQEKEEKPSKESEKKGGFLGALRKFLKGGD